MSFVFDVNVRYKNLFHFLQNCIQFILHNEFDILDKRKFGRSTFQHFNRASGTMVWSIRTVNIYWCLLWFQKKGNYKLILF